MKIKNTTLVCIDGLDIDRAIDSVNISKHYCEFEDIKLLSHIDSDFEYLVKIPPITSITEYSEFVLKELTKYVETDYVLITQHDGFILNPSAWNEDFFNYDYLGAPWNLRNWVVGNGGFSLRSKKLLIITSHIYNMFDIEKNKYPEDFIICGYFRDFLERHHNIKFPSVEFADTFSVEDRGKWTGQFGFHSFKKLDIFKDGWNPPNIEYLTDRFINKVRI